jgi:hypothetical protein
MEDNGSRTTVPEWPLGPGWSEEELSSTLDPDQMDTDEDPISNSLSSATMINSQARLASMTRWIHYLEQTSKAIPSVFIAWARSNGQISALKQARIINSEFLSLKMRPMFIVLF